MSDWLERALKTFIQAIIPVFIANATLILNHLVAWDFADWKGWLMPILISAISAGISAVWNLVLEYIDRREAAARLAGFQAAQAECAVNMIKEEPEVVEIKAEVTEKAPVRKTRATKTTATTKVSTKAPTLKTTSKADSTTTTKAKTSKTKTKSKETTAK